MIQRDKIHIALLAGGTSGEREVSLKSGDGARQALTEAGFKITQLDPGDKKDLEKLIKGSFDLAFLCLHGRGGEDGAIQGFLETLDMPYTGSGIQASAIAMDKAKTKILYESAGIPTAPSITLEHEDSLIWNDIFKKLGTKCVIKPATEGSSIGVSIVDGDIEELAKAIDNAFEHDSKIVIEKFVEGIEVTVAVLGNNQVQALPIIQMVPKNEFYDFESKYAQGGSEHICPAPLNEEVTEKLQKYAVKAHKALGCKGVSRTDFIIDNSDECWCLETNTIPGMTATSLLPDAASEAGISFPFLCTKLVEFALE